MKNEALLMQKKAGIITESEYKAATTSEAKSDYGTDVVDQDGLKVPSFLQGKVNVPAIKQKAKELEVALEKLFRDYVASAPLTVDDYRATNEVLKLDRALTDALVILRKEIIK